MFALRLALAFVLSLPALASSTSQPGTANRLVSIADIHGAYSEFTTILQRAGLVDAQLRWAGGRTTFVQTGDSTDRGTDVRKVLDLLMRLEREARAAGGRAVLLIGNHEVMNAISDWRDVTPEICATFATPQSEQRREESWRQYERVAKARVAIAPVPVYQITRAEWLAAHPPGCLEYREAMGPDGIYGRWFREKDIAAIVDGTLFMHAGVNPSRPIPKSIAEVNDRARAEMRRFDGFRRRLVAQRMAVPSFTLQQILDVAVVELRRANAALAQAKAEGTEPPALDVPLLLEAQDIAGIATWSLVDPDGPLWFRGYALWEEAATAPQVTAFLDQWKLQRIVVGHSVTPDNRAQTRYNGRVILMDTGMLRAVYKGTPAALEISGTTLRAIYPDGDAPLK